MTRIGERNIGLVCIEHIDEPHHWRQDEIAFAIQLADKIGIGFANWQRRTEEERRRASEVALAEAQKIAQLGSWSYDPQSNIAIYSEEVFRILNVDPESFDSSFEAYLLRVHPDDRQVLWQSRDESVMHQTGFTIDYRLVMDDDSIKWVQETAHNYYDAEGRHTRQTATIQDITARKTAEETIARLARFDSLTGLANRIVFVEKLQQAIAWARRSAQGFAVLYLDLDHFKDVNDTLGHPIGDQLLQEVAHRLLASVRETDTVARFGGDEFAIILVDIHEPEDAAILADKILKSIDDPFSIQGNVVRSGASIGIDVLGTDSFDAESLLSHADVALYRAKSEGRGTYRFFTDAMDAEVRTRVTMDAELREAIAKQQFFLLYQPQVDIRSGGIVGLEALVRWRHPKRGVVGPGEFIPFAEKSGLIVALGQWVMREACFQTRQWLDAGIAPPLVAVNISGLQFKTKFELENDVSAILAETGVPPRYLELELTESVLMDASREHNDVLIRLRQLGVRIAIDDFGTGYSSLDYLRRFPVDRIKIAQVFVTDLGAPENTAIVKAALGLAHALSIEAIIEGVETVAQLELLKAWGCRYVQGYCFARPLPVPEVTQLLRKGRLAGPYRCNDLATDDRH